AQRRVRGPAVQGFQGGDVSGDSVQDGLRGTGPAGGGVAGQGLGIAGQNRFVRLHPCVGERPVDSQDGGGGGSQRQCSQQVATGDRHDDHLLGYAEVYEQHLRRVFGCGEGVVSSVGRGGEAGENSTAVEDVIATPCNSPVHRHQRSLHP